MGEAVIVCRSCQAGRRAGDGRGGSQIVLVQDLLRRRRMIG